MTDYDKWEGKDSDFTFEELADAIDSRLRWDAQVKQWQEDGDLEWINHRPFDPTRAETLFKENNHGH